MAQLIKPGTPVIGNPFCFSMDMASGRSLLSSPEAGLVEAATCEFIKRVYKIPVGQNGFGTDSHVPDAQAGFEQAMMGMLGLTTQSCDFLIGAGALSTILAVSPIKLVADATMLDLLNRIRKGVEVTDETLAVEQIMETDFGGHFIKNPHTVRHCRDNIRLDLMKNPSLETWKEEGEKDFYTRAREKYMKMKDDLKPLDLSDDLLKEFADILKRADEKLSS
jgi:trimethylamine--corrinoid protein Co-methyltransferase